MDALTATVEMLIRKPPEVVFNAFANPRTIEQFWLKRTSGPMEPGATVTWEFMVAGAHETVTITEFVPNKTIAFTWSDGISVTLGFAAHEADGTRFSAAASGFKGADAPSLAIGATEGFTIVACDLKSLLETGQSGNMVRDKAVLIGAGAPTGMSN